MEVPRSRGPGRSGPRRRTGCLTCRARKVRCDEAKPTCANCTRLNLQCLYKSVIVPGIRSRNTRPRSTSSTTQENDLRVSPRSSQQIRPSAILSDSDGPSNLNIPFDMIGFISDMTSDFQQKHLDLTNRTDASAMSMTEVENGLFYNEQQMTWNPAEVQPNEEKIPEMGLHSLRSEEMHGAQLLEHFRHSEPPPTIFGPVDLVWKYVRQAIISEAESDNRTLLQAIYCYSDFHRAWIEETPFELGPQYHVLASSEIQSSLLGEVSEASLQRVFMSLLLLMLAELISRENWRPATSYLHTAYLILDRFQPRIETWTGLFRLVASWVSLLDIKALVAGRDGDPLARFGAMRSFKEISPSELYPQNSPDETDPLLSSPTYLIAHSITAPAFTFFLATQQLIRRIVEIDLHHRTRGTVSDEFEVLQIAHNISGDLEMLWNRRPRILDLHALPSNSGEEPLHDSLAPPLGAAIVRTFRSYVASFLALFVYLHRVAFAIYPRTDKVYRAVDQIIHLAKEESARSPTTQTSQSDSVSGSVPMSFVWPLFIAALEGSIEQREWIVTAMQRMTALKPGHGHPNARKALVLLEEMMRRQDASRMWADSRCVRQELFADFFVMI